MKQIFQVFEYPHLINTACANKYSEGDIVKMLDFLIDNIFVEFGGRVFKQTVGIPMGTF